MSEEFASVTAKDAAQAQRDLKPAAATTFTSFQTMLPSMPNTTQAYISAATQLNSPPGLAKKHLADVFHSGAQEVDSSRINTFVYTSLDSSPPQALCYDSPPQAVVQSPLVAVEEDPLHVLDREIAAAKANATFTLTRSSSNASPLGLDSLSVNKWKSNSPVRMSSNKATTVGSTALPGSPIRSPDRCDIRGSGSGFTRLQGANGVGSRAWSPPKLISGVRGGVLKVPGHFALAQVVTPFWRTEPADTETPTKFSGLQPATSLHYLHALNPINETAEPIVPEGPASRKGSPELENATDIGHPEDYIVTDAFPGARLPPSPEKRLTCSGRELIKAGNGRWVTADYLTKSIAFLELSDNSNPDVPPDASPERVQVDRTTIQQPVDFACNVQAITEDATPDATPEKMQVDTPFAAQLPVDFAYNAPIAELTSQDISSEVQAHAHFACNSPPEARAFWSNHRYCQGTPTPLTAAESAESLVHVASFGEIVDLAQAQLPVVQAVGTLLMAGKGSSTPAKMEQIAAHPNEYPIPSSSCISNRANIVKELTPALSSNQSPVIRDLDSTAEKPSIPVAPPRAAEKRKQDSRQTPLATKVDVKKFKNASLLREALLSGQVAMPALRTPKDSSADKRKQDARLTPLEPRLENKKPRDYSPRFSSPLAKNNENASSTDTAAAKPLTAAERRKRQNDYSQSLRKGTLPLRPSDRANRVS